MRKLLIALALLLALAHTAAAAGLQLTIPEFVQRLEATAGAVAGNRLDVALAAFPGPVAVETPQGLVPVDMSWFHRSLAGGGVSADERSLIADQLRAMAREARAVGDSGAPGLEKRLKQAAADRATLHQILNSAGYREAELPTPSWWDRFWGRVGDWFAEQWEKVVAWWGRQWSWVPDLPGVPEGVTARTVGWLAIAVIIAVLLFLLRGFISWDRLKRLVRRSEADKAAAPAEPADLRRIALEMAELGQRREAIKLLMQAVLGRLSARKLIDPQPTMTNRAYLRQLRRRRPDLEPALEELNRLYEYKVYGERPASAEEFRRGMAAADRLWEEGSSSSAS